MRKQNKKTMSLTNSENCNKIRKIDLKGEWEWDCMGREGFVEKANFEPVGEDSWSDGWW